MNHATTNTTNSPAPVAGPSARFFDYYRAHGVPCQLRDGVLWIQEGQWIRPIGPINRDYTISKQEARSLLAHWPGALVVYVTDGFLPAGQTSSWYAIIGRRGLELNEYPSKIRSTVSRGLRENEVKKVDAEEIARHGYETHVAAFARYKLPPKTEDRFRQSMSVAKDFADVIDFWAVYHEGVLAGFAQDHCYENVEVNYSAMAFHPGYFKFHTSYALIHTMNHYYLRQRSYPYLQDGFRSVSHDTGFQEYLVSKFGFERVCTHPRLYYRTWLAAVMAMPRWSKRLAGKLSPKFAALCTLDDAARGRRGEDVRSGESA
jgi:hypothetical protein